MDSEAKSTSVWIKVIAASVTLIAAIIGYQALTGTMNEGCRSKAMQASILVSVRDTKWTLSGCQYLYSLNVEGSNLRWEDGDLFEDLHIEKPKK